VGGVIYPSTVTGLYCEVGFVRTGTFPKRNCRSTSAFSSLFTTCADEVMGADISAGRAGIATGIR
jgi:hypothetical protein